MKTNQFGQIEVSDQEAFDCLYSGRLKDLASVFFENPNTVDRFNQARTANADDIPNISILPNSDQTAEQFHRANQQRWFMPKDYSPNLIKDLYSMCDTDQQRSRVTEELELFIQHNMIDLLYYLKYLVDTMRENNIVWGVGRGSSVASYVLYLLGVHKIDSIKYNLDIKEFLK